MIVVDDVEMVDVREAARLAGRTSETIRRWVWNGRLTATKQGNRLLVPRDEVLAVAGGQAREAAAPRLTLAEWEARVATSRTGTAGTSAADLVQDDRARR